MIQVSKIDVNGNYVEPVIVNNEKILAPNLVSTPVPDGFYQPKWNGTAWVEGKTQEEIGAIKQKTIDTAADVQAQATASDPNALAIAELTEMVAQLSATIAQLQPKS